MNQNQNQNQKIKPKVPRLPIKKNTTWIARNPKFVAHFTIWSEFLMHFLSKKLDFKYVLF